MASRTIVIRTDDIDGGEGAETVSFGLDGVNYEIDLGEENAQALRDALAPYVPHARRVSGGRGRAARGRGRASGGTDRDLTARIREWARANGHEVSDRGRLPATIVQAYEDAH